jgi:CBS domain-containing protein
MATSPVSIPESASLSLAIAQLREHGIHRLPVTRDGRVVGIVTGSDLLLALLAPIEATHEENRREELRSSAEESAGIGTEA